MPRHILLRVGLVCVLLITLWAQAGLVPAQAQTGEPPLPAAPTDTPETFHTDVENGIYRIAIKDNLLYYHSPCGGEFDPARGRVRSLPTAGGPVRNLYYPATCQSDFPQSQNIAIDTQYVYWLTSNGKVVRLPRGASAGDTPQIVASMVITGFVYGWITVDNTHVYWSEGAILYRAPKDGSGSRSTVFDYSSTHGAGTITQLTADGAGAVYLMYANTVYRDRITLSEVAVSAAGRGQGFTLGNNKVYWSEKDAVTSAVYLKSATMLTPTTGLATLTTINGTGNPVVYYLAVDSTNLYWHESRSNLGPIQRMANTGGIPASITVSMGAPNSLVTDGRHIYWNDFSAIYRLSTAATAFTLDLTGNEQPIEVIQAVQNGTGGVTELVRGKETFVRVYGRIAASSAGLTSIGDLRPAAMLRGFQGATELPGSPLMPTNFYRPLGTATADRTQLDGSFWFRLPSTWLSNTITLRGEINPNHSEVETNYANNISQRTVTFAAKSPICLDLVPVNTIRGSTIASFNPDRGDRFYFNRALSLLPTTGLRVFYRGGPLLSKPRWYLWDSDPYSLSNADDDSGWLMFWSNLKYLFGDDPGGCGAVNANTIRVTMAPDHATRPLNGLQSGNSLLYFTFSDVAGGFAANSPGGGTTLAHEIGHAYGRGHVNCPVGDPAGVDGGYPYPTCQLDNVGANSTIGYDRITNRLLLPADTGDLMSYAHRLSTPKPRWTSDYTWKAIYNALNTSPVVAQPDRPTAPSATLIVAGVFSSTGVYVSPAYQVTGTLESSVINRIVASTQQTTTYEVRVYDAANVVIGSALLRIDDSEDADSPTRTFMNWVFYSSENTPTRVSVVRLIDNATLGSFSAGANPPTVNITSPSGGSYTTGLTATWTGNDPDGDTVLYTVRYSPDNGTTWLALSTAQRATQLGIPFNDGLPGGPQARLQVLATDGIHTAVAISAPFNVARHAPQVAIYDDGGHHLSTVMITSAQQSDIVVLNAEAYDAEDGPLSGSALQWAITGPITQTGSGEQLTLFGLPPATYGVRLTATDTHGLAATTTTSLTIAPKHVFDAATPTLDGYCSDSGYTSDLDPITLRYTDIISAAQVHFAHGADGAMWACFSGLRLGGVSNSFAGLRADVDNSGGTWATANDLGFFVGRDGIPFTVHGDGAGGFPLDAVPNGLTAAVSQDTASGVWNAELRIDAARLGGWNHLVKLKVSHYWRNFGGDDTVWPLGSYYNVPATWGLASLGQLNQSITFAAILNHGRADAPFAVTASASSNLPVAFESLTPAVCTVLGNTVTLVGSGTCTLRASQSGDATYLAATAVTRSFNVIAVYLPLVRR